MFRIVKPAGVCFATASLLLASSSVLAADLDIDITQPVPAGTPLTIENAVGSVTVHGADRDDIQVSGKRGDEAQQVRITRANGHMTIKVAYPDRAAANRGTDLVVSLPQTSPIVVGTVSGAVDTDGRLISEQFQTVSGDLLLEAAADTIAAQSVSGDIDVEPAGAAPGHLELASTSGDINYHGDLAAKGVYRLEAVSGDIELVVPGGASARYRLATLSGDIDSDLGPAPQRAGGSPKLALDFTRGAGEADVMARSVSGDISLSAN